jgi:hypothetical protein
MKTLMQIIKEAGQSAPAVSEEDIDKILRSVFSTTGFNTEEIVPQFGGKSSDLLSLLNACIHVLGIGTTFAQVLDYAVKNPQTYSQEKTLLNFVTFQTGIAGCTLANFDIGNEDRFERSDRFLEKVIELLFELNYSPARITAMINFVRNESEALDYEDEVEINRYIGGVMVTLSALCTSQGIDLSECSSNELARITKESSRKAKKKDTKPHGSELIEKYGDRS